MYRTPEPTPSMEGYHNEYWRCHPRVVTASRSLITVMGTGFSPPTPKLYATPPPLPTHIAELHEQQRSLIFMAEDMGLGQHDAGTDEGGSQQPVAYGLGISNYDGQADIDSDDETEIDFPIKDLEKELRANEISWLGEILPRPDEFGDLNYKSQAVHGSKLDGIGTKPTREKRSLGSPLKDALRTTPPPKRRCTQPYSLLENLLSWHGALDRREIPWDQILGLSAPKNIPVLCLSFWATDTYPPTELMRVLPDDVQKVRYSEVHTFREGHSREDALLSDEAQEQSHTTGRWTFITLAEHPQNSPTDRSHAMSPWHIIAFPSNAITRSEERIYDLDSETIMADSEGQKSLYAFDTYGLPYPRLGSPAQRISPPGRKRPYEHPVPLGMQLYMFPPRVFENIDYAYDREAPVYASAYAPMTDEDDEMNLHSSHDTLDSSPCPVGHAVITPTTSFTSDLGSSSSSDAPFSSSPIDSHLSSSPYSIPMRSTYHSHHSSSSSPLLSSSPNTTPDTSPMPPSPRSGRYLRRTILYADGQGSIPLVQTFNTDPTPWKQVTAAFARGAGRIMVWSETEAGRVREVGRNEGGRWPEWVFRDD
ncbi:uncharacterized protein BDZ99DRAFT_569261 [Mytilinidion resinicola]|uniref:Uncharacterized protein n=1 Tax=Mytilinidion resinicola TaxID=574789 RepID=A0A6A6YUK5_9PEZI|nr:uncharacterized protein BDZ99DRAFT_569261 [Mytilinidion resinicola]KAF2812612.1 hypothetical protein BDZ99DRAFT_569261 [Mytilinidion resinicola]